MLTYNVIIVKKNLILARQVKASAKAWQPLLYPVDCET